MTHHLDIRLTDEQLCRYTTSVRQAARGRQARNPEFSRDDFFAGAMVFFTFFGCHDRVPPAWLFGVMTARPPEPSPTSVGSLPLSSTDSP